MTHTKGKLITSKLGNGDLSVFILREDGVAIASSDTENDASRLVACWNALDGIEDPELWVSQMEFMESDHQLSIDGICELQKERDELVGLLRFLMYEAPDMRISDHEHWRIKIDRVHSILAKYPEPQPTKEPK